MLRRVLSSLFLILLAKAVLASGPSIHHELSVTVDPDRHYLVVEDVITIPASQSRPVMHFLLHSNLSCTSKTRGITIETSDEKPTAADFAVAPGKLKLPDGFACKHYVVKLPPEQEADFKLNLTYEGEIHHPVKEMAEEYARSFSETPGLIDSLGVYLGGTTYWIPWFNDELITYDLTVTLPLNWDAVSQGDRTVHQAKDGRRQTRWQSPQPMEEVYLIAAEFSEYQRSVGAVTAMAFLRAPDENLANKYLETTAQYLEMYRQLIGPYPYSKFALVENFWETGYGMPSFTLLGQKIIRFPFILHSSYPHELLHNWWGNGVFVDYDSGNWCEGLTAYMADHLIKEQRGQGSEYRRSSLQRYTDYVNESNDFPLTQFRSRYNAATEAVGYGKCLMVWNMLRQEVGDDVFVKGFQTFYRNNQFQRATFGDIREAFEGVTGMDLRPFFDQWIAGNGAPELGLSDVKVAAEEDGFYLDFTLSQVQPGETFQLKVPVAVYFEGEIRVERVEMSRKKQSYRLRFAGRPLRITADPQFDLFRRLHPNEIPPALSKVFGAEKVLILLPSKATAARLQDYEQLAEIWSKDQTGKVEVRLDSEVEELPSDKAIWLLGWENRHRSLIEGGIADYDAEIAAESVRFGQTTLSVENHSFIVSVRHPQNPNSVLVWLRTARSAAIPGLARKLPHYGKYSYLAFEGDEPSNIAKGQWTAVHSPMSVVIPGEDGTIADGTLVGLPPRDALATLGAVFSEDNLRRHVDFLASKELEGRGLGSVGLDKAANYIAEQFKKAGLLPGGEDGSYFQSWRETAGEENKEVTAKNVIGILPGNKKEWQDQSVIVCAHYDHLGRGWPDAHQGNQGKIHFGADDNASGVAVMLELAHLLGKSLEPDRTIIFVAFTAEESGLRGSKHYVKNIQSHPVEKVIGVLNLDTVGRLQSNKIMVIGSSSAREWKFIFMGSGYVTGIESEMITQDLDASDQVSFIDAGVPAVQFFSGARHDYHRPTDTADKIDAAGMVKVATFVKEAIVYLSEREEPLTFQGKEQKALSAARKPGRRKVSTGTMPDFAYSGEGVRVAAVSPDSPAAKVGLQEGDIIIQLGEHQVDNLREYSEALKTYSPGDRVKLVYLRHDKRIAAEIELTAR